MSGNPPKQRASGPTKGPRISKSARIDKRPLVHPPVSSARAGAQVQKVVYVRANSPFVSVIKRVEKFLREADRRAMGNLKTSKLEDMIKKSRDGQQEEILVKATGRAIEKALHIALFFQGRDDCVVRLRTGGVATVDDIIPKETNGASTGDGDMDEDAEDMPESRLRKVAMLEVAISLK